MAISSGGDAGADHNGDMRIYGFDAGYATVNIAVIRRNTGTDEVGRFGENSIRTHHSQSFGFGNTVGTGNADHIQFCRAPDVFVPHDLILRLRPRQL